VKQDDIEGAAQRVFVCLAYDGAGLLELAGMHKVFWESDRLMIEASQKGYRLYTASEKGGLVETLQGVSIDTSPLSDFVGVHIHTLILPGAIGLSCDTATEARLLAWLTQALPFVQRVIAAGSALFLLAKAGVLTGKRAVIHSSLSEALKREAPHVKVDGYSLFTGDDFLWTYAGAASAIDLALAVVDNDCGREASIHAARHLAVFARRTGCHPQLSEMLVSQMYGRDVFHDLHVWVQANQNMRVTVDRMAEQVAMSTRNFSRVYKRNTGSTPAKAVERFRLDPSSLSPSYSQDDCLS
jgi:transcriptional regulator GlxA family with amidase domain